MTAELCPKTGKYHIRVCLPNGIYCRTCSQKVPVRPFPNYGFKVESPKKEEK